MRTALFCSLWLVVQSVAHAQDVSRVNVDLTGGAVSDPEMGCALVAGASVAWFDSETSEVYAVRTDRAGSTPFLLSDSASLAGALGSSPTACRAATYAFDQNTGFFAFEVDERIVVASIVFETTPIEIGVVSDPNTDDLAGLTDMVFVAGTVYVTSNGSEALENGVYAFDAFDTDQAPTLVASDADLSPVSLSATTTEAGPNFLLFVLSDGDGAGPYENALLTVGPLPGSNALTPFARLAEGGITLPLDDAGTRPLSVEVANKERQSDAIFYEAVFVAVAAGDAFEVARFSTDGTRGLFVDGDDIQADLGRTSPPYAPTAGPNVLLFDDANDQLFLLGGTPGGADEILRAVGEFVTVRDAGPGGTSGPALVLDVYPTVANGMVHVGLDGGRGPAVIVRVYDVMGREVARAAVEPGAEPVSLDVSHLASGSYVVVARSGALRTSRRIVVVR